MPHISGVLRRLAVLATVAFVFDAPMLAQQPEQPCQQSPQQEPPVEIKEEVVVTATHTDTRLQDQPLRIEVIDREDIERRR